jgi:hypothetical protein
VPIEETREGALREFFFDRNNIPAHKGNISMTTAYNAVFKMLNYLIPLLDFPNNYCLFPKLKKALSQN